MVASNVIWQAIFTVPLVEKQQCKVFNIDINFGRDDLNIRPQTIGDGENAVAAVVCRQRTNCYIAAMPVRNQ